MRTEEDNENDEFVEDSKEAGLEFGRRAKEKTKPIFDSIKSSISDWWRDQKEIKDIEKEAYKEERKKQAAIKGRLRAKKQLNPGTNTLSIQSGHPKEEQNTPAGVEDSYVPNIMKEGYYDK